MPSLHYPLHDIGEGIYEAEIIKWLVQPGDRVAEDQIIVEVRSDKSIVEIPSPVHGIIHEIKVPEGRTAAVGDVLVVIETAAADRDQPVDHDQPVDRGQPAVPSANAPSADVHPEAANAAGKAIATPGVRRLAREKGIDLSEVWGTGRGGRITPDDLAREIAREAAKPAVYAQQAAQDGEPAEERMPLKGIRKAIAEAMVKSMYTAPQATIMDEADAAKLVELRDAVKPHAEKRAVSMTYMPFFIKAIVAACRQFPMMNASFDDATHEIVLSKSCHIGVAMHTEQGLLVPVIRHADRKHMWTLAEELGDLTARGRRGKLAPGELKGSTITITNIGSTGGLFFTPILNYPECAIVGIGRMISKPVARGNDIVAAPVLPLSISFDHRIVDGATAQRFMNAIKERLEQPAVLLMEV